MTQSIQQSPTAVRDAMEPYLNKWGPYRMTRDEMSNQLVRMFCEVAHDGNPVYWDEEFAKATAFGRLIAPPQGTFSFTFAGWWTPDHVAENQRNLEAGLNQGMDAVDGQTAYALTQELGYVVNTMVGNETEFIDPYGPGDGRIKTRSMTTEVSPEKQTQVGRGVYITSINEYRTEKDDRLIARGTLTLLRYDASQPRSEEQSAQKAEARRAATGEAEPVTTVAPERSSLYETRSWDDLREGDPLTVVTFPLTYHDLVVNAAGTRDLYPIHHDREFAKEAGARDVFVNTMFYQGLFGRIVTDWGGPESFLRRIRFTMRQPNCPGDVITSRSWITRKYREGNRHLLDIESHLDNQLGRDTTIAQMTAQLPWRPD